MTKKISMSSATASAIAMLACATARADDAQPVDAAAFANRATAIYIATELTPLPIVADRLDAEGAVRIHRKRLALEARFGLAAGASLLDGNAIYGARAGVAVGYAFPVGARVALVPMAAYDLFVLSQPAMQLFAIHRFTFELPVSIVVYPHVVLEPWLQVGVSSFQGTHELAFALGPRIGIAL